MDEDNKKFTVNKKSIKIVVIGVLVIFSFILLPGILALSYAIIMAVIPAIVLIAIAFVLFKLFKNFLKW